MMSAQESVSTPKQASPRASTCFYLQLVQRKTLQDAINCRREKRITQHQLQHQDPEKTLPHSAWISSSARAIRASGWRFLAHWYCPFPSRTGRGYDTCHLVTARHFAPAASALHSEGTAFSSVLMATGTYGGRRTKLRDFTCTSQQLGLS